MRKKFLLFGAQFIQCMTIVSFLLGLVAVLYFLAEGFNITIFIIVLVLFILCVLLALCFSHIIIFNQDGIEVKWLHKSIQTMKWDEIVRVESGRPDYVKFIDPKGDTIHLFLDKKRKEIILQISKSQLIKERFDELLR